MLKYASYTTFIGEIFIVADDNAVVRISFEKKNEQATHEETSLIARAAQQLQDYLGGKIYQCDFKISMTGTDFQKAVWSELLRIPYGEMRTYRQVAESIGHPHAWRAVGNANNNNPLPIVIPCHRVIGNNGHLTGYAGGIAKKRLLLDLERNFRR